ncbi:hypothetical protein ACIQC5_15150 [Paenarthrobacter sp. NPDC092416]|uniref:hypothetical protein n=1 Tax=Paenarthrobacter sp. NPDC092416 TaxID=3364386 RepID=UPI003803E022
MAKQASAAAPSYRAGAAAGLRMKRVPLATEVFRQDLAWLSTIPRRTLTSRGSVVCL